MTAKTTTAACWAPPSRATAAAATGPRNAARPAPPPAAGARVTPAAARTALPSWPHARHGVQPCLARQHGSGEGNVRGARPFRDADDTDADAPATSAPARPTPSLSLLVALASTATASLLTAAPSTAAGLSYDPGAGSDFLKNVAGAAYVVLLVIFAARLLRRRASTATSTRLASAAPAAAPSRRREVARATPGRAAWAAVQAGACAVALYALCVAVDGFFEGRTLPDGYSARNIAVTLRTIGRGLAYLLTFIFAANAVGLAGLAVQLVFYPEPEDLYAAAPASGDDRASSVAGGPSEGAAGAAGAGQPGDGQGPPPPAAPL